MENQEENEIDGKKYTVITRVIKHAQNMNNLYEAFSQYAIRKLNMKVR